MSSEVFFVFPDSSLEIARRYCLVLAAAQRLDDFRELDGNLAPGLAVVIDVIHVDLVHEVVCQEGEVGQALQDAVHVAGVAEVP